MSKLKILITHSDPSFKSRESIDLWRIIRPFAELEKHVDWQIDHQDYLVDHTLIDTNNRVKANELVKELQRLGSYDIVWTGYFPDAVLFDCMTFVQQKFGTKFVLDADDDFWNIPPTNPIWRQENMKRNIAEIQYCITETPYMVTSSPNLLDSYKEKRGGKKTYLLENFIGGYKHKPFDNGENIVISFFGGASHKKDVENSGFLEALKLIMKKYKHVHAGSVGLPLKITGTLKKRYTYNPGIPGQEYVDKIWPAINADIAVAPLEYNIFNRRKTNIKWQETAMIPAAFVGTNIPPYKGAVKSYETGILVNNTVDEWFYALEQLVTDKELRLKLAHNAKKEVEKNWSIENNWQNLKKIVEEIHADN